jgi:UPF0271 protein
VRIDLNADVGESSGLDEAVMQAITSANVAAGVHAGNASELRRTIRLARDRGVAVGAHPGFADAAGFGRRDVHLAAADLEDLVLYQVAAVAGVAAAEGVRLRHVKPHGAMYNMAAKDAEMAAAIARAIHACDPSLIVYGLPRSELLDAARAMGLRTAAEGFADRGYQRDGTLVPRDREGALVVDARAVAERAVRIVKDHVVAAVDGFDVPLHVDTICIHGDTPGAGQLAVAVRSALEAAGITVAPVL